MSKLFGTDGIRGVAGRDLTADLCFRLGVATGKLIIENKWDSRVIIGRDSRISGPMLEAALTAGIMSTGSDVHVLGIAPTPAVAYLTRELGFPLGCVLSASHNPIQDNGIKFFDSDGLKVSQATQDHLEELIKSAKGGGDDVIGENIGSRIESTSRLDEYVKYLNDIGQDRITGLSIVVDAAYGAGCMMAPAVFTLLGTRIIPMNCLADGSKINVDCGSTNVTKLSELVVKTNSDLGVALDGDADRAILVDEKGQVIDGDQILAMWGLHLLGEGQLKANTVVGTVLSNQGLEVALGKQGGKLLRAPVGDRFVMEDMVKSGAMIGGEQSGHLIFREYHTTGDGLLTAIMVAILMREKNMLLSELGAQMTRYPQVQLNISVKDKSAALASSEIKTGISALSGEIDKLEGRLLVRPSGTESVIRVMTEAPDESEARKFAEMAIDLFQPFSESGTVTEL